MEQVQIKLQELQDEEKDEAVGAKVKNLL